MPIVFFGLLFESFVKFKNIVPELVEVKFRAFNFQQMHIQDADSLCVRTKENFDKRHEQPTQVTSQQRFLQLLLNKSSVWNVLLNFSVCLRPKCQRSSNFFNPLDCRSLIWLLQFDAEVSGRFNMILMSRKRSNFFFLIPFTTLWPTRFDCKQLLTNFQRFNYQLFALIPN